MVKEKRSLLASVFVLFLFVVLFMSLASASFTVGNKSNSIDNSYGKLESVRGWINISLDKEPTDSLFQDSGGKSVRLIDLLKNSSGSVYSCSPVDCSSDYNASNAATSKTFTLEENGSKVFGLRFTGDISRINSINFTFDSNAAANCKNQIEIDVLNDETLDMTNNKVGSLSCSAQRSYGCYESTEATEEYVLGTTPYCQRINLSASSGFNLGAWVKKVDGSRVLKIAIFDESREVANCELPSTTGSGQVSCNVNYVVPVQKEYYVCIYSASGTGNYRIRGNTNSESGCGFVGLPLPTYGTPAAYEIFAEARGFDAVGSLQISNSLSGGKNFGSMAYDYISRKYGSLSCSTGCVVPIKFTGLVATQQVTIKNLAISYQKTTGAVTDDKFYDLNETPAKVSSNFQKIYLDKAGFSVPDKNGIYKFSLKLNGNNIFSEDVNISNVPRINSLRPTSTASAYPTNFVVNVSTNSSAPVSKFFWDFGDNITGTSTTTVIGHTYNSTGNYTITITATDSKGMKSTKYFDIEVSSPKDLINASLTITKNNLNRIKTQTSGLSLFSQQSINSILEVDNVTREIAKVENSFNAAETEAEYNQIITDFLKINTLPRSVSEGITANSVPLFPDKSNINLEVLKKAGGGNYDSNNEDGYADAILIWNQENLNSKISFKEFLGNYDGDLKSVVKVFELNVEKKGSISGSYFLIMPKLENLEFDSSVVVNEYSSGYSDYVYVDLSKLEKVSFSTTGNVDFTNLPAFISPSLSKLSVTDAGALILPEEKPKWMIFGLAILFLLILAFVVYIILQEWYRIRYENYLFKNKNDLYNMVNYVHNSKKKGMHNKEIAENLRKAKWTSEQVTYVMKKYAGERTGMFEIPIFKFFRKGKKVDDGNTETNTSSNHKKL